MDETQLLADLATQGPALAALVYSLWTMTRGVERACEHIRTAKPVVRIEVDQDLVAALRELARERRNDGH